MNSLLGWIKNIKPLLKPTAIAIGLTLISLELGALIFYLFQEKKLFYTRGPRSAQLVEERDQTVSQLKAILPERLHPYFGYTLKQGAFADPKFGLKINNYGFSSVYDYPFIKTSDRQFIIGVLGGSVAIDLVNDEVINQRLSNKLKQLPELANKQIIVLNLAGLGYKQPQQLLILNYFLAIGQKFDLVINLDGFNEIVFGSTNNQAEIDISMPSIEQVQPVTKLANQSLSTEVINAVANIYQIQEKLKEATALADSCSLAMCYAWRSISVQQLVNNYRFAVGEYKELLAKPKPPEQQADESILYLVREPAILPNEKALNNIAKLWSKSSLLLHQTLALRKIPYLHILQPNQYYSTQRTLTQEEQQLTLSSNNSYSQIFAQGYPLLLSELAKLRQSQVNIINATNIFDNISYSVYRDRLGHYNPQGQEIFTNYVGDQIKSALISRK